MLKARLAEPSDDAQLREIVGKTELPGIIKLKYLREPSFFSSLKGHGKLNQTIIVEHEQKIAGLIVRSIKDVYINGRLTPIGYIHSLRILSEYCGSLVFLKGLKLMHELHHKDNLVHGYLISLINGNKFANLLLSQRYIMPMSLYLGKFCTYALFIKTKKKLPFIRGISVTRTTSIKASLLNELLEKNQEQKQFYPHFDDGDLADKIFYLAYKQERIVGVLGVWDQNRYKQIVITHLPLFLNWYLTFNNAMRRLIKKKLYPGEGEYLKQVFISNILIEDNSPQILELLLTHVYNDLVEQNKYDSLIIGLHERENLLKALNDFRKIKYFSKLYLVFWAKSQDFINKIDSTIIPYMEVGTL